MTVRLFISVELSEAWRDAARAARAALERQVEAPLRWVDPRLMHLTLRFLGEVPEEEVSRLRNALDGVPPVDVQLALKEAGTFGPASRTAVVWLAIGGDGDGLRALADRVEAAVVSIDFEPEQRPFRPHVTLARVDRRASGGRRRTVAEAVERLPAPSPSPFTAHAVALVRSHLGRGGPRYEVLSRHG